MRTTQPTSQHLDGTATAAVRQERRPMDARRQRETDGLIKSWMRHDAGMLRDYLVADAEDPRLNVPSILTRHFLLEALLGRQASALKAHEFRFAVAMSWLRQFLPPSPVAEELEAVLHALRVGADNAEGRDLPSYVVSTFTMLPDRASGVYVPNYLSQTLRRAVGSPDHAGLGEAVATFQRLWRKRLAHVGPARISVLEPACGSANDYRFFDAFGLARFLDYSGLDLCEKNVQNARMLFPEVRFEVGNVFEIAAADKSFDFCMVHDLFEHLSVEGMEVAIAELCRVTRRGLCLGFFNMDEIDDHLVRPVEDYHWNTLSLARVKTAFEGHSATVRVMHIGTFLNALFGAVETHNPNAYTLIVTF